MIQLLRYLYQYSKVEVRNSLNDNPARLLWLRPLRRKFSRNRSQNSLKP